MESFAARIDRNWSGPRPLTSLVGRENEIAAIRARLAEDEVRLLTLLGPGGCGKTRVGIEVGRRVSEEDGIPVVFVDLTAARQSDEMLPAIARAMTGSEAEPDSLAATITAELDRLQPLLILDNVEQINDAALVIGDLLSRSPALTVLATSRIPLRLSGEQRWPLEPLSVPSARDPGSVAGNPAVALFERRARLVQPRFSVDAANGAVVAEICRRLDGLPLAIELAAARLRVLSPEALLARLSDRLTVLSGDSVDRPDRQRAMRATIAWSVERLPDADRQVFAALSVFPSTFSIDGAGALAEEGATAAVEQLLDHNLVNLAEEVAGEPRFRMLETIRQFGRDLLAEAGQTEEYERRAAHFALDFMRRWSDPPPGESSAQWISRIEAEENTIEQSLGWFLHCGRYDEFAELAALCAPYWWTHNRFATGVTWLERAMSISNHVRPIWRGRVLRQLGQFRIHLGDLTQARQLLEEALAVMRAGGDRTFEPRALNSLSLLAHWQGDRVAAIALADESQRLFDVLGEREGKIEIAALAAKFRALSGQTEQAAADLYQLLGELQTLGHVGQFKTHVLKNLAEVELMNFRPEAAEVALAEALTLFEASGDVWGKADCLVLMTYSRLLRDPKQAKMSADSARALAEQTDDPYLLLSTMTAQAVASRQSDEFTIARSRCKEIYELVRSKEFSIGGRGLLEAVAVLLEDRAIACRLLGALDRFEGRESPSPTGMDAPSCADLRRGIAIGDGAAAYEAGRAMSEPEIMALVETIIFDEPRTLSTGLEASAATIVASEHPLSAREVEVLRLLAAGKTNAQIGEALFISPLTAKTHVANLLGKLGVDNRAAAAAWASAHGLA